MIHWKSTNVSCETAGHGSRAGSRAAAGYLGWLCWVCTLGSSSSTLLPGLLMPSCSLMAADPSPSSVQLPKAVPKGTAANQRVQHTDPAHTALAGAHLQPSSRGEGLMGGCTGALVHTQPHPALAGSSLLLSSSSTHPWLLAEMFLFPSAPTKGWTQSCLARHKLTTSQAKKQESVWQLDKMYPRSCRKPIDQD